MKIAYAIEGYRLEIKEELTGFSFKLINPKGKELVYLLRDTEEAAIEEGLLFLRNLFYNMIAAIDLKLRDFQ